MQVLKKICSVFGCMALCCCSLLQKNPAHESYYGDGYRYDGRPAADFTETTDYAKVDLGDSGSFRVAVLLPLSGNISAAGQSLKNAATMAIGDVNNNKLVVQFYDTKGTGSGARVAVRNALDADSSLILGPLLGDEVAAISDDAMSADVPVISFSTSPSVLREGVYTLGLLNTDQINRMVGYAASQGRTRLAAVFPDNRAGMNMYKSVVNAAREKGVTFVKAGFYAPSEMDFTQLVTQMKGSAADFDVLLIPESGNRLKAIASMFSYYDVSAPDVLFMGTSVWDSSNLSKETELYGAVYPVMSLQNQDTFNSKYEELFGEKPDGLGVYAYDAVALAAALSSKDKDYLKENITNPDGYTGMSGLFRILPDGRSEHGLDVVKVTPSGRETVESAPAKFAPVAADANLADDSEYYGYGQTPQIFGKSAAELQNIESSVQ